jgi:hypothetical protein
MDWSWVRRGAHEVVGALILVRGATPAELIAAFGLDPERARPVPADRIAEAVTEPVYDEMSEVVAPWVRAGQAGEWALVLDSTGGPATTGYYGRLGQRLSAAREAVVVSWNPAAVNTIAYYVDTELVTRFEAGREWERSGQDPDRFLAAMRQLGLRADPAEPPAPPGTDPLVAALDVLTVALGIELPEDVITGPLLTVQGEPPA